jgi:hypothetical protein
MFGILTAPRKAAKISRARQLASAFAAVVLFGGLFCQNAAADGADKKTKGPAATDAKGDTWGGLGFGLGIAADFDTRGNRVVEAELDGNRIVRVKNSTSNVNVGLVLEAHYFLRDYLFQNAAHAMFCGLICSLDVAHGPFVAVEVGTPSTTAPVSGPITAYALGWMVGLHHPTPADATATSRLSSWNFGVGLRIQPDVKVLGDGIVANQPLPANDTLRYKQEPRAGIMLLSSFSF